MRKMRPNFQFKPRLVASGEYDKVNTRYVLDNKLELNKVYLVTIFSDDKTYTFNLILSTFRQTITTNDFETSLYSVYSNSIILSIGESNYLKESSPNERHASNDAFTIYVYELFGVSGV